MKAFVIYPVVTGRDELLADERYCTPAGGCLCICPSCKVNTHVTPNGINVSNDTAKMRFAWGVDCCYVGIYSQYICTNTKCPNVMKKLESPHVIKKLNKNPLTDNSLFQTRESKIKFGYNFSAIDSRLTNDLYPLGFQARLSVRFLRDVKVGWTLHLLPSYFALRWTCKKWKMNS